MHTRTAAVALGALIALALPAAPAAAGPPGKWTQLTTPGASILNIMRPGLARTTDGVLHVTWTRDDAGNADSLLHSALSADAKSVSGPDLVFTGTDGVNASSALVVAPDGLRAFLGSVNNFSDGLGTALSGDAGKTWNVKPTPASRGGNQAKPVYAASGIAAALGTGGTVFSAWGASSPSGAGFHIGLEQSDPDGEFDTSFVVDPGVGVDSQTGAAFVAMSRLNEDGTAIFPISPAGASVAIPDSNANQLQHPTHVTGRIGKPGVYVAYTKGSSEFLGKAALWDVGAAKGRVLGRKGDEDASVAAAPDGRLWVFWRGDGDVRATRSNPAVTEFGRVVRVRNPKGTDSVYDLTGNGSRGPLDVLLQADTGAGPASWHQRILPGLSLTYKLGTGKKGAGKVFLKVTDAGDPVKGATVKVKGQGTKTTSATGNTVFKLGPGRYRARASKDGYSGTKIRVRVR